MDVRAKRDGQDLYDFGAFTLDGPVVWPGVFVDEGILTVHVAALRRVLGDTRQSPAYIETVSRWGYRFIGVVRHAPTAGAATSEGSAGIARRAQS